MLRQLGRIGTSYSRRAVMPQAQRFLSAPNNPSKGSFESNKPQEQKLLTVKAYPELGPYCTNHTYKIIDTDILYKQDPETGRTILIDTVLQKPIDLDLLGLLLRPIGSGVNIKDNDGFTALMHAIQIGDRELVQILLLNCYHDVSPFFTPHSKEYQVLQQLRAEGRASDIPEQLVNYIREFLKQYNR